MRRTRDTPWRDNLDIRLQAIEGELESYLVVTLSGTSVRYVAL